MSSDASGIASLATASVAAVSTISVLEHLERGALAASLVGAALVLGSNWTVTKDSTRALLVATTAGTSLGIVADKYAADYFGVPRSSPSLVNVAVAFFALAALTLANEWLQ